MIRIGLVGEDPSDTKSIFNLLNKRYSSKVIFIPLIRRVKGHQLDNKKVASILPIEFKDNKCNFILYIRDLDALASKKTEVNRKKKWFDNLDSLINKSGIFLLNIWELEAIILADIETFNKDYNIKYKFTGNPSLQEKPKEKLMNITYKCKKKYVESHCPDIFNKLNLDTIRNNLQYFNDFIIQFETKIKWK